MPDRFYSVPASPSQGSPQSPAISGASPLSALQNDPSRDYRPRDNEPVGSAALSGSQSIDASGSSKHQNGKRTMKKSKQICRFYGTKKGCRAQDQCPYLHVAKVDSPVTSNNLGPNDTASGSGVDTTAPAPLLKQDGTPRPAPTGPVHRPPVAKPVSSLQQKDPREFQINQVVRRFSPSREEGPLGTILRLRVSPSDPDFPFELEALECTLTVPATYPKDGKPSIKVENSDIPRGFQINLERGFDSLCSGISSKTLLQLLNDLDRNLERFLTTEKAQTIKIVANRRNEEQTSRVPTIVEPAPAHPRVVSTAKPSTLPSWTAQQKADAKLKRDTEIRQLEARMSRVALFSSSKDTVTFNVPLQIPKPPRLPLAIQSLKEVTLIVPTLYDLEPCRIKLKGVMGPEVNDVEVTFEKRAKKHKEATLMAHINYLTQNIHTMAVSSSHGLPPVIEAVSSPANDTIQPTEQTPQPSDDLQEGVVDQDRPHLRFISQPPPEWSQRRPDDDEESNSQTSDEYGSDEEGTDASDELESQMGGASVPISAAKPTLEKGVLLSFPQLELHGIELLELRDIALSVKCDRCKETIDIKNIKPAEPTLTSIRTESCNKCASSISVSYRSEPMHVNSIKAGYLDLEGCTVVDLLPSHFLPTCSECSTTQPPPGVISVRGESPIAVCRDCHHRLNFKIPEVKFLRVSSNDPRLNLPLRSKRKKENLGITAGSELPERGRCKHYSKSYRWFRFSCCNRVYPCDRCHDEKEEHPNEHANRMICGWCSREQNYRPEDCHACGRSVIRKTGGGFWEGGKGTRDKNRMSRKDPRKYKRIGGGAKGVEK